MEKFNFILIIFKFIKFIFLKRIMLLDFISYFLKRSVFEVISNGMLLISEVVFSNVLVLVDLLFC